MRTSVAILLSLFGAGALAAEPSGPTAAPEPSPDAMVEALSLPGEELRSVPGTWGDPLRALARFPGAATVVGGMGPLVIRGRLPDATPTFVDGVRVSWPFHLLVGPAAISPQVVDKVDYYRGEAPARFGFLTGGAIDIHLPEHAAGTTVLADLDLLTARAAAHTTAGPLNTRVLAAAGAFYTPWLYSRASAELEANLVDWQLSVTQPVGIGELRLLWLGAYDGLEVKQGDASARPAGQMHRVDLRYRCGCGTEVSATYGLDRMAFHGGGQVNALDLEAIERTFSARVRWARTLAARGRPVAVELGAEVERRQADFQLGALVQGPATAGEPPPAPVAVAHRAPAAGLLAAAWAQAAGTTGALTVTPGLRLAAANLLGAAGAELAFEPRVWVDYRPTDAYDVHGGAGWYHQPATTLVPLPGFQTLHLDAGMSSVIQTSAGVTFHPLPGLDFSVDGYWDPMLRTVELSALERDIYDEVFAASADAAAHVAQKVTRGSALGMELLLRKSAGDRLTGWISYSVQRSVRFDEALAREVPFAFDQAHVLNAVIACRLPGGWTLSASALLRSGAPEVGSLITSPTLREGTDAQGNPAWVPVPLDQVDRLPPLFRIDARVSKAFDLDRLRLEVWLDVYDANLARDVSSYSYGSALDPATGQRVLTRSPGGFWYPLPMLGLRGTYRP